MADKRPRPLTDKQLRTLLATRYDDRKAAFPNHPRRFLDSEYQRARDLFPPEVRVERDMTQLRERSRMREAEQLYKTVAAENADLRRRLKLLDDMPEVEPREVVIRTRSKSGKKREATAIVQASDWHMEEQTTLEQTSGLNEYNLAIAKRRADFFFRNSVKLVHKEAQNVALRNVILWFGGDFFTGSIHPDCAEGNALGPMDAIALVQDTLAGGLNYYLAELPSDTAVTVVCSVGNHSRITKEQRVATEHENSLEWFAYGNLAREYRVHPRVTFVRQRAYHTYVDVHGTVCRFHHGHQVRYSDGVGGLSIPLLKKIYKWNAARPAHHDFLGHFHTRLPSSVFTVNGSLIGTTPYGIAVGGHEKPVQAFTLVDSVHGVTVQAPILLEAA